MKGFDPSQHTREELVDQCEILERHEPEHDDKKSNNNNNKNKPDRTSKFRKTGDNKKKDDKSDNSYFCKECGPNGTHATNSCYKIKNREKRKAGNNNGKTYEKQAFSKRTFHKEVNALARKARKNGAMDLYTAALKRAQVKNAKTRKSAKSKSRVQSDPESSDSDESMHNLEDAIPRKVPDL